MVNKKDDERRVEDIDGAAAWRPPSISFSSHYKKHETIALDRIEQLLLHRSVRDELAVAIFHFKRGDFQASAEHLKKYVDRNVVSRDVYFVLGVSLFLSGAYQDAVAQFERLSEAYKDDPLYVFWLAKCYDKNGQSSKSKENYRRVFGLDTELFEKYFSNLKYSKDASSRPSKFKPLYAPDGGQSEKFLQQLFRGNPLVADRLLLYYLEARKTPSDTRLLLAESINRYIEAAKAGKAEDFHLESLNLLKYKSTYIVDEIDEDKLHDERMSPSIQRDALEQKLDRLKDEYERRFGADAAREAFARRASAGGDGALNEGMAAAKPIAVGDHSSHKPALSSADRAAFLKASAEHQWDELGDLPPARFIQEHFGQWFDNGLTVDDISSQQPSLVAAYKEEILHNPRKRIRALTRPHKLPKGAQGVSPEYRTVAELSEAELAVVRERRRLAKQASRKRQAAVRSP